MHDMHDFKSNTIPRGFSPSGCCPYFYLLGHKIFGGNAVNARVLLQNAEDSGVDLYLDGDALKARGCRTAVEILSPQLRAHKAEIVELLASAAGTAFANSPAGQQTGEQKNLPKPAFSPAPENCLAPAPPFDPDAWRALTQAYYAHHFNCPVCIAAGRGTGYGLRCGTGAALWTPGSTV